MTTLTTFLNIIVHFLSYMVADLELWAHEAVARGCGGLADGGGGAGTSGLRQVRAHVWINKISICYTIIIVFSYSKY